MTDFTTYEFQPLLKGQVCVARSESGVYLAYRAVPTENNGLRWEALDPQSFVSQAAINGYCAWLVYKEEASWVPTYGVSHRQIAQLVANRASILALAPSTPLIKIALLSINNVLRTVACNDIGQVINALSCLGLDIGNTRNRLALQLVINVAVKAACEHKLDALSILPLALDGFDHATRWIDEMATPLFLLELARLAHTDEIARDLAANTTATMPAVDPVSMMSMMALEA